jgi:phage FluMu gp28-like protein
MTTPESTTGRVAPPRTGKYFLPYQIAWIRDQSRLKLMEKSRQVGISFADAYDSVMKASAMGARLDVFISSRDETQARLYLEDCQKLSSLLNIAARALGASALNTSDRDSAYVLQFPNGRRIYSLSSNPNALAGKHGHVKLDEFALHADQRLLYRVAKPVTTWGGTLSIISTHRGAQTVFNQLIRDIRERGNPMGWSLHSVPVERAVTEGLCERINEKTNRRESREEFLKRLRAECIDDEQWLQEYCCQPADEASAFITYDLMDACVEPDCLRGWDYLAGPGQPLFLGLDVARKKDLCVFDIGEKIGDVVWDRMRLEMRNRSFSEIESELWRLLRLPRLRRACLDATGLGMQLAERAQEKFHWKVDPVTFTAARKEELAFGLRHDFEDHKLRIPRDDALQADLRGMKKQVTPSGNIQFLGETEDSHCDRFWAKALRQQAARHRVPSGGCVA